MKSICLIFEVNRPFMNRRYRFFDIGTDHYYYDDYSNETTVQHYAAQSYLPAGQLLLKLIERTKGRVKVSFANASIIFSGPSMRSVRST